MSTIIVVGAGTVGYATGSSLASFGHEVHFVDRSEGRRQHLAAEGWATAADHTPGASHTTVFLCVPTPASERGYDLSALEQAVRATVRAALQHPGSVDLVVRSTVPPGTCDGPVTDWVRAEVPSPDHHRFAVIHCPEFLRQAHAVEDALHPRAVVVGSVQPAARERISELMSVFGAPIETFDTATAAELVKCSHNAYNAAKISFWNEIDLMARTLGVDSSAVSSVVARTAEASWNPRYGISGGRPYAGACLPKDVLGLIATARALGMEPTLLEAVDERNRRTGESQS